MKFVRYVTLENFVLKKDPGSILWERTTFIWFGKLHGGAHLRLGCTVEYDFSGSVKTITRRINRNFAESSFCGNLVFASRGFVNPGDIFSVPKGNSPIMVPIQLFDLMFGPEIYRRAFQRGFN